MDFNKSVDKTLSLQKKHFITGETASLHHRESALKRLRRSILHYQVDIEAALFEDLGKSKEHIEKFEIDIVINEIDYTLKNLESWMNEDLKEIEMPDSLMPSKGYIKREPFGVCYIIGPFNYPINLTFAPLIGAIAGGNTAIIKPSENTPNTAKVIEKIINDNFEEKFIKVYQGSIEENKYLLSLPFDFIFFTGSPNVGKVVMKAASEHLTPFVLELGGKSPFIIEESADLKQAAEQLIFGKLINSGQTCIAPDYVYIDKKIKENFLKIIVDEIKNKHLTLGEIGKLVSSQQVTNVSNYVKNSNGNIIIGGEFDIKSRHFQPTVVDNVNWDDSLMQQELFSPIIPIITFDSISEVDVNVNKFTPKPLAVYVFTKNKSLGMDIIDKIPSGDAQINAVISHVSSPYFPFGGVGPSGIGEYHGKYSFMSFTHRKSIRIVD